MRISTHKYIHIMVEIDGEFTPDLSVTDSRFLKQVRQCGGASATYG